MFDAWSNLESINLFAKRTTSILVCQIKGEHIHEFLFGQSEGRDLFEIIPQGDHEHEQKTRVRTVEFPSV